MANQDDGRSAISIDTDELENRELSKFKSATVTKEDDLIYDLGNLTALDNHQLDLAALKEDTQKFLIDYNRDNVQLLINKIFKLPSEKHDVGALALLPPPVTVIPREKPLPKEKSQTKWEQFKKAKGIRQRKKEKQIWDSTTQEWRRRYGYKRANDINDTWVIEAKPTEDAGADPFEELKTAKKSRVEKQKKSRKEERI